MAQKPLLPLELEREIFETAAYRTSIEPVLYRVLAIAHDSLSVTLLSALEAAMESKPASFFQTAVRHVYLAGPHDPTRIPKYRKLLECSSGILALCIDAPLESDFLPALNTMRLQKVGVTVPFTPSLRLDHPLFLSVTHLDIYADSTDALVRWEDFSHLASMPALTHLALSDEISDVILPQVITECTSLVLVLLLADFSLVLANTSDFDDPRVVVTKLVDYRADWMKGAWGGDDMWARADKFLARKRRGEIPSTCFLLEDSSSTADSPFSASVSVSEESSD
ncbi:hypothetical protein FB451DRAFT_1264711 [Mycena latifolia]|nr:hypothetical protein FB451DRAFT_1264711 [Mycena latifolia]